MPVFNVQRSNEILLEAGSSVLEDYANYNQRMRIRLRCKCGIETTKRFEMLNLYRLPYCEECSKEKIIQKGKNTCMKKYGVDNAAKSEEIKKKINEVHFNHYGGHPKKNAEVQAKWKATCLEKYGGHPNQNKDIQIKSEATSYHYKTYMMPSGNLVKYQGYENLALDKLVQTFEEEDIMVGRANIPTIEYLVEGKKHVYFPDFFIKSENKIIEVKSEWTIQLRRENIEEKAFATVKAGYKYEIWIYTDKKILKEKRVYS